MEAYSIIGDLNELNWRLRNETGSATPIALMDYVTKKGPSSAVADLVLISEPITRAVAERLHVRIEHRERNEDLTERFLWRLGFDLPRHPEQYRHLARRLTFFEETVQGVSPALIESERVAVRGAGVNLFVSVGSFLLDLLSYAVWFLGSDHFLATRFHYTSDRACDAVSLILGSGIKSGEQMIVWSAQPSLGTLNAYLHACRDWVKSLPSRDRDQEVRPKDDLPHYVDWPHRIFAFRHVALWADADSEGLNKYIRDFDEIVRQISQSNLAKVRNGLDHQRDEAGFPSKEEMLAFVDLFRRAFRFADLGRYIPKWWWLQTRTTNRYGLTEYELRDYDDKAISLRGPSPELGLAELTFRRPVIIGPVNLTGFPNADLIFIPEERSNFSDYWKNYPRRRKIPSASSEIVHPLAGDESNPSREIASPNEAA
jgi:hypothetical protein